MRYESQAVSRPARIPHAVLCQNAKVAGEQDDRAIQLHGFDLPGGMSSQAVRRPIVWLTRLIFAVAQRRVSPSYGECQATEKRVSGFSSLESNEVAKFFSG
jgi:hypothetical protein